MTDSSAKREMGSCANTGCPEQAIEETDRDLRWQRFLSSSVSGLMAKAGPHRKIALDGGILTGCNILVAALGFFAVICVARVLSKSEFGEYAYALALGQYAYIFVIFSGDRTVVRDLVQRTERRYATLCAALLVRLCLLAGAGLLVFASMFLPEGYGLSLGQVLVLLGVAVAGLTLEGVFDYWGQYRRHAFYNLTSKMLFALLVILPLIAPFCGMTILWIGFATIISALLLLVLQFSYMFHRLSRTDLCFNRSDLRTTIQNNRILWVSSFGIVFYVGLNRVVLRLSLIHI